MDTHAGHRHPLSHIIRQAVDVFTELGFAVADGPEIETEYYNFDALNVPKDHPARDMQDTFYVKEKGEREKGKEGMDTGRKLLRTHTSPVQVHYMETHKPPFRIVVPGRVFRQEATDATHEAQFYQLEGLMVDESVTLATMKVVLESFFKKFLGESLSIRLRPSFFPFVEPGAEIDVSCFKCQGKGCNICKQTGWIEIMGAGMVHPKVLNTAQIDFRKYQGFAFGMGVDRIAMLKYGIDDIRLFYSGDLRFINQF